MPDSYFLAKSVENMDSFFATLQQETFCHYIVRSVGGGPEQGLSLRLLQYAVIPQAARFVPWMTDTNTFPTEVAASKLKEVQ